MILTLEEYKKYLPLNTLQNYNSTITEAHETRALYKWFPKFLGSTLVETVADESAAKELMDKIKPALANLTFFEALPFLNLVLTGSGFGIISNPNMAPASTERIRSLAAGLLEASHNYLDSLLAYLENNMETYDTWNQCSLNTGSLLSNVETFDSKLKINESRVTFVNLIPFIKEVETNRIANLISEEFLEELIAGNDENVKPLIQYACAFWAWQRILDAKYNYPGKPNEKDYLHTAKKMLYQKVNPQMAGKTAEEYMLKAISYLNKNLATYTTYNDNAYEAPYENKEENGFYIT